MPDDVRQAAPKRQPNPKTSQLQQYERAMRGMRIITTLSLIVGIMAVAFALTALGVSFNALSKAGSAPVNTTVLQGYNVTGSLITPNMSLPNYPVITTNGSFGSTLYDINAPLNSSELAVINDAPDEYFEIAGQMLLNGTLNDTVGVSTSQLRTIPEFVVNGKPSVIYLGSITCMWCGENRWAMALALSRFGNFSTLFTGYSSYGDYDFPTLYWAPAEYTTAGLDLGSFYNSKYINFIAFEDTDPITQGFNLQSFTTIQQEVNATGNTVYEDAFQYILTLNDFGGTPYTIWGNYRVDGADAQVFGNSEPQNSTIPLTYMTHAEVLSQFNTPNDQFAWGEYAAADVYIAMMCKSISNTAPVCSLPAIKAIEQETGY